MKKKRTWLDLLLNRELKPADPEQSLEHLESHPLTHDRRRDKVKKDLAEAAEAQQDGNTAPEQAAESPAAEFNPGQHIYGKKQDGGASERLRQSIINTADQASVEQDDVHTEIDADTGHRKAPRRHSKRVLAPTDFLYFVEPDQFVSMELTILLFGNNRPRALDCYLYDVTDQGIGFACPEQLEVGASISVCAHLSDGMDSLVDTMAEIRNVRPLPEDMERPAKFGDRALWIHGALLDTESAKVLLKATLDCITLQYATAGLLNQP